MSQQDSPRAQPLTQGPFAGWMGWPAPGDPFEDMVGPLAFRQQADGRNVAGLFVEPRHTNSSGAMHGGAIMTFIDYTVFVVAMGADGIAGRAVTLTCNVEFVGVGRPGALLEGVGEVIKETRSLIFLQGRVRQEGNVVAAFSATLKKMRPPG